jgi:hypothetical protein
VVGEDTLAVSDRVRLERSLVENLNVGDKIITGNEPFGERAAFLPLAVKQRLCASAPIRQSCAHHAQAQTHGKDWAYLLGRGTGGH